MAEASAEIQSTSYSELGEEDIIGKFIDTDTNCILILFVLIQA